MSDLEAEYRAGRVYPTPSRITTALDLKSLYGPEVDIACLAVEPAVDEWEAGKAAPSWEQLVALAALTGMAPEWFMKPDVPSPHTEFVEGHAGFICVRHGKGRGCHPIVPKAPVPPYRPPGDMLDFGS